MFKKPNTSGWILCHSKSYPGKFYYFNVLNGEAAWCLNEKEKKAFKKEVTIQKVKENHLYPEPITPPDHPSPSYSYYNNTNRTCLPTFGQAIFPKYISNDKEDMAIVYTPIQMLQLVTNTKKLLTQNTHSDQHNINVNTHISLTKRFEDKKNKSFGSFNYVTPTQPKDWWNSTNIGKQCDTTDGQYKRKLVTMPILKESKLKNIQCKNKKDVCNKSAKHNSTQFHYDKVKNPKAMPNSMLNLDINDLRYVLRNKRRKCVEIPDLYSEDNKEYSTFDDSKKVTFNTRNDKTFNTEEKYISEGGIYTNDNQQEWYVVVDLDVLLEDYDIIKRYIDKDKNCRLYIPSVIQNRLQTLCMGEHSGRSRVIVARQLLRKLGSMTRLNLPENKEDPEIHQIINCCLEIIKRNHNVVLITKDIELINRAKLYEIKVYHIYDIKSNHLEINFINTYEHNLFLQNKSYFDPFSLSKILQDPENNCRQNISGTKESFINEVSYTNKNNSDISDIILNISKLNLNDKILNIKNKIKNNLFENKIVRSNVNFNSKSLFHNITINKPVQSNSKDVIKRISNKDNINITFNANKEINKHYLDNNQNHYTNMNLITKPLDELNNNIFKDMLKQFKIKNHIMEHNIYVRFDEWICFYKQIIEEFLYIILQINLKQVTQPPPWFLHEGLECLKEIYRDNKYIINIIEKLLYYYDYTSENGTNIKPYNFMKLFGCGFYLVEALENTSPLCISDIKKKLIYLRDMLECPIEDLVVDSPIGHYTEDQQTCRYNFVKNPSYVLDYLKKHFSEWKNCHEGDDNTNQIEQDAHKDNMKVLRTCGRDLKKMTINKSKCLSFIKETDNQTHNDFQSNAYPKVIRNIKLLDSYEEKIKRNENGLNYQQPAETISSISLYNENRTIINKVAETNAFEILSENNDSKNNDFAMNDINDSTKDSGLGSNSLHAYNLVRNFLSELSSSFKIIHTFIDEGIKDYSEDIAEENKKNLYEKANKTHTHIAEIIDKLKIIIQRESMESSTLKTLLIKSGRDDKRTTRYRPVVMKCLEQATILENSLKLMLAITNEEVRSVSSKENIHFINIYE